MNRIDKVFKDLKQKGQKAFIPYITAGDPDLRTTKRIAAGLRDAGADILELGIPFSDPLADGPTIQKAIQRSLRSGCSVKKVFSLTEDIRREISTPIVYMTYFNIVYNYGMERFIRDALAAGADGIIVPDLPMEESGDFRSLADKDDFHIVMLAAPTTPIDRFKRLAACSKGFIYYVSLTGVTGARKKLSEKLQEEIRQLKKVSSKPICVGFGVSTPDQAREIAEVADGVIVGSALIKMIESGLAGRNATIPKLYGFARSLAKAVHGVKAGTR